MGLWHRHWVEALLKLRPRPSWGIGAGTIPKNFIDAGCIFATQVDVRVKCTRVTMPVLGSTGVFIVDPELPRLLQESSALGHKGRAQPSYHFRHMAEASE